MANIVVNDGSPVVDSITIYQGATFSQAWEYAETVEGVTGPPLPAWPAEWIGRLEIRAGFKKAIFCRFHSEDTDADGLVTLGLSEDELAGTVSISLSADASSEMTWNGGIWDLELEHVPTGRVVRILAGKAVLNKEVTILE